MAGVVFAALSVATIVLANITLEFTGSLGGITGNGSFRVGPDITSGVLLALLWGVVGGAIGGLWEGRALPPRAAPEPIAAAAPSERPDEAG
jgi:hypothetical protein